MTGVRHESGMAKSIPWYTRLQPRFLPDRTGRRRVRSFCGRTTKWAMDFHRRLEHSSRPGSAYFVTWRLDGSLPVTRVTDFWTSDGPKFVELDQLLDAVSTGPRWLERRDVADVVAKALWKGVGESRYELGAWVLMPNHVHRATPTGRSGSRFYGQEH